ncbi:MAG: methyltransferase domain-containing protein [Burkholderiales bacterium]|nr:methyltransferase domain-containing protein [Burkholderiales bacterium]
MPITSTCPFCKTRTASEWGSDGTRPIYQCPACGPIFFDRPIVHSADYAGYYPYLKQFDTARFRWELAIRRNKYRYQLATIRKHHPNAIDLLDIGAGPGYFCKIAMEEDWRPLAVEPSPAATEAGTREHGIRYVSLAEVTPASMDAVTCFHVLEHIEEPAAFLRAIRSTLRPGGILVIHVPNRISLSFAMRNLVCQLRGARAKLSNLYYPEHISGFCDESLPNVVTRFGFEVIRVRTVAMWSPFYDPFFLRNYFIDAAGLRKARVDFRGLLKHALRSAIDNAGVPFGRGDWIVGHFRASI